LLLLAQAAGGCGALQSPPEAGQLLIFGLQASFHSGLHTL